MLACPPSPPLLLLPPSLVSLTRPQVKIRWSVPFSSGVHDGGGSTWRMVDIFRKIEGWLGKGQRGQVYSLPHEGVNQTCERRNNIKNVYFELRNQLVQPVYPWIDPWDTIHVSRINYRLEWELDTFSPLRVLLVRSVILTYRRPWHSIVLPTTPALMMNEVVEILPELFVHAYYFGANFRSSLLRVWAKSTTARTHTGFIIMDRQRVEDKLSVSKVQHGPHSVRPYGVQLPIPESLCGCWDKQADWRFRHGSRNFGEKFYFFRSSCCAHELHMAIYEDCRKIRTVHGATIVEEDWDESKKNFTFNPARMVHMVQSVSVFLDERSIIKG